MYLRYYNSNENWLPQFIVTHFSMGLCLVIQSDYYTKCIFQFQPVVSWVGAFSASKTVPLLFHLLNNFQVHFLVNFLCSVTNLVGLPWQQMGHHWCVIQMISTAVLLPGYYWCECPAHNIGNCAPFPIRAHQSILSMKPYCNTDDAHKYIMKINLMWLSFKLGEF